MNIWEIDKLQLFLIFFVPGFISIKVYDLFVPGERRDFSKSLVEAIAYSALNFALLSWLIALIHAGPLAQEQPLLYFIALFFILFIFPVLWPILWLKIAEWGPVATRINHPILRPWDRFFRKRGDYWVIIHLTDGRTIGGIYDEQSFASSFPASEQIYIAEVWRLDEFGAFIEPIKESEGMLILGKEMLGIEFFRK